MLQQHDFCMNNPWKTLRSSLKYENPWIRVDEHEVINASGNPGIYGTVHFKNCAVGVVPYEDGYVWMVGQFRYPLNLYSWEIPEGGGPSGEDSLNTAKRELKEETGLVAEHYRPILQMHLSNSVSDEWGIVYLATGLTKGEAQPEEDEELKIKRLRLETVFEAVEKGQITDSLTVAAIYKMMILNLRNEI